MAFDANNLYGHAIVQYIPTGGLTFLPKHEITRKSSMNNIKMKILSLEDEASKGYTFQLDL